MYVANGFHYQSLIDRFQALIETITCMHVILVFYIIIFIQEMERFMIFCYVLLSMAIISDAALCISTVDCPGNDTLCILNCSEIAVNDFNQPASHGNCRNFLTFEDVTVQDCYIDQCNASHPELCVPAEAFNDHTAGIATGCCCAEDLCNSRFDFLDETTTLPTNTPGSYITTIYDV